MLVFVASLGGLMADGTRIGRGSNGRKHGDGAAGDLGLVDASDPVSGEAPSTEGPDGIAPVGLVDGHAFLPVTAAPSKTNARRRFPLVDPAQTPEIPRRPGSRAYLVLASVAAMGCLVAVALGRSL